MKLTIRRPYLTTLIITSLAVLYSCTEDSIKKIDPPGPGPGPVVPEKLCQPNFSYGYTNRTSYLPGETVVAYLQGKSIVTECALVVYDLKGDSVFAAASTLAPQKISTSDPSKDGYGFLPSAEFDIPDDLPSGIYMIEKAIPIVVKPKEKVDILVVYASNTVNAYSTSGGKSLYTSDKPNAVSFHRPMTLQGFASHCLNWLYSFDDATVGYIADVDMDNYEEISKGDILCLVGHNEYWTRVARKNFDKFVASGHHAVVLSGNVMWWQVRYSDDADKSKMICYKSDKTDPISDPLLKTALWSLPLLEYPIIQSIGADFDNGGYGLKSDNGWNGYKIVNATSPLLAGTGLANGDIVKCPTTEWDGAPIKEWSAKGYPIIDKTAMNAHKAEIIAFDKGFRLEKETVGTFIVFQHTPTSGIIVNTGSTDWCSPSGMGGASGGDIKIITRNILTKLLNNQNVFTQ